MPRPLRPYLALALLTLAACDDPPKNNPAAPSATPTSMGAATGTPAGSAPPAGDSADRPKLKSMPELLVDDDGPYLGGQRANLAEPGGAEKLAKIVKELPFDGKPVNLEVSKKAKVPYVVAVVTALGDAGAPRIVVKTDGRGDLPKEITLSPESRVSSPAACSEVAMVLKDLSTAIWPIKGGTAKKQRKGLAGPDLSHTQENLEKDLAACDSNVAFFSTDDSLGWETAFNIAGTILVSDKKKKIESLVLLRETPVAGRAVTVGKH